MKLSKVFLIKNVLLNCCCSVNRKIELVPFENWVWKSDFGTFWSTYSQNATIFALSTYVDFWLEIYLILYIPPLKTSQLITYNSRVWNRLRTENKRKGTLKSFHIRFLIPFYINLGIAVYSRKIINVSIWTRSWILIINTIIMNTDMITYIFADSRINYVL